jgi:hypothetical protein
MMPSAESKTAGEDVGPRYEFRIWAPSLTEVRERLESLSGPQPAAQSRETYIVSDATDDTNAKIRAGAMDIKVLLRTEQNLEQWNPYLKAQFPIDAKLIAEKILPALRVDPPDGLLASRRQLFTAEDFVDTVVKSHPRLAAVDLGKMRRRRRVRQPARRPGRDGQTRDRRLPEHQLRAPDQIDARTRLMAAR